MEQIIFDKPYDGKRVLKVQDTIDSETKADLESLASRIGLKSFSSLNKGDLLDKIVTRITDKDNLRKFILTMPEIEIKNN